MQFTATCICPFAPEAEHESGLGPQCCSRSCRDLLGYASFEILYVGYICTYVWANGIRFLSYYTSQTAPRWGIQLSPRPCVGNSTERTPVQEHRSADYFFYYYDCCCCCCYYYYYYYHYYLDCYYSTTTTITDPRLIFFILIYFFDP